MSVPKIAIDPHWVEHVLVPYLRHVFGHDQSLRRNHDITPYVERALNFCETKPVSMPLLFASSLLFILNGGVTSELTQHRTSPLTATT